MLPVVFFIDDYIDCVRKNNSERIKNYLEGRFGSDVSDLKKMEQYDVLAKLYNFLKDKINVDEILKMSENIYALSLFDLAYGIKEAGEDKSAKILYEHCIEVDSECFVPR